VDRGFEIATFSSETNERTTDFVSFHNMITVNTTRLLEEEEEKKESLRFF